MNIGGLAKLSGVSTDTLRYYEKQNLLAQAQRHANGYRHYQAEDVVRVAFIRSAQSLGFSLAEIRDIVPQLSAGRLNRGQIEARLTAKLAQIQVHVASLRKMQRDLRAALASLTCEAQAGVGFASATRGSTSVRRQNAR